VLGGRVGQLRLADAVLVRAWDDQVGPQVAGLRGLDRDQ